MKLSFHIINGSSFEIDVNHTDTLLQVKQKIQESQHILVSQQTLIVNGSVILREDLNIEQCNIIHDSCLQLQVSHNPNHNGDDQIPQTEQPIAPWVSIEDYFVGIEWPLTEEERRKLYSYQPNRIAQEFNKNQDSLVTEQSQPSTKSYKEIIDIQEVATEEDNALTDTLKMFNEIPLTYEGYNEICSDWPPQPIYPPWIANAESLSRDEHGKFVKVIEQNQDSSQEVTMEEDKTSTNKS